MKNLKYMLFIFLFCCINIAPVLAKEELMKCEYNKLYLDTKLNLYIKYRVTLNDDNTITHEYVPSDSTNYKKASNNFNKQLLNNVSVFNSSGKRSDITSLSTGFTLSEMQKYYQKGTCPYALFTVSATGTTDRKITPVDTYDANKYKNDSLSVVTISTRTSQQINKDNSGGSNNNNSISCVYGTHYSNVKVNCIASSSSLTCDSDLAIMKNSLKLTDFKSNNNLVCPATIGINVNENGVITDVSLSGGTDPLKLDEKASTGNINSNPVEEEPEPTPINEYENDERYQEAKADADKYCDATNFAYQDDAKCEEARNKMNAIKDEYKRAEEQKGDEAPIGYENFCTGKVQGVFTSLGWIFFALKIIVPIILIVFGIIDFSKAMVASKDDEIKKAAKSLIIRIIGGFIIFFVPYILGLIVDVIDSDSLYKGTFWDCTKCILEPNNGTCSGLGGN